MAAKPKEPTIDLLNEDLPVVTEVVNAAPAVAAELPVPEGWFCNDLSAFGIPVEYRTPAEPGLRFSTLDEVYAHLNKATIDSYVAKFMAHTEAHPEAYFSASPRKDRTTTKDRAGKDGVVIPAGTVIPGRGARLMTGMALGAAKTRLESAARLFVAWQYQDQAAG